MALCWCGCHSMCSCVLGCVLACWARFCSHEGVAYVCNMCSVVREGVARACPNMATPCLESAPCTQGCP